MQAEIPLGLRQALEAGDCVLFVGAGIGAHLKAPDGNAAPDGPQLARDLANHFTIETNVQDLSKIAQVVEVRKGRQQLLDFVRKRFANLEPDQDVRWISKRNWRAIFTTNYDLGIERVYELSQEPMQKPVTIALTREIVAHDPRFEVPIIHLHGTLYRGHDNIVITQTDYAKFREQRRMLFDLLKKEFAASTVLYIGYSNQDPNWALIQEEIAAEFYPKPLPVSYRVAPNTDAVDLEILKAKNVETVTSTFQEFVAASDMALADLRVEPDRLKRIQATVPSHLATAFERNPAAVARLLNAWVYVNQAQFNVVPNTQAFLEGDRPNWALISKKYHFERDIEEEVYEELLDYGTGSPTRPTVSVVLGPAGYGMTTLLMSLGVRLVQEMVGPVYMHKAGAPLTEGDVLFASTLFPEPAFFLVDDAADCSPELQSALTQLRGENRAAAFLLAERKNEWMLRRVRVNGKEFPIESLSDPEIYRLLDCLGSHNALNKLEHLPRDFQFTVVREKHGKELLVAMREATEGKGFDAIIEDEYRGIATDFSKQAYLIACCFSQHGAYIRDSLLASMLGCNITELYETTNKELEGVIVFDAIDEARGIYAGRARHRVIAAIVWERCGSRNERDRLLQSALEQLNLAYQADRNVFEKFIRSDHLIDGIQGLEKKIKFFETACRKEPDNPYVRQHYARMLSREDNAELALSQVEEGIKMSRGSPPRVLLHSKGVILGQLALGTEGLDVSRRRLVQSEDAFQKAMNMNPRDEYVYQSLASLYLDWAKTKATSDAEATDYISKAEEVINSGLKKVRERDGLWIVSSEIEKWLGDTPSRFKALEKAVKENPGGIVGRYLLGRAYRRIGKPESALATLEPLIKGHHEEFRSFVEYALSLLDVGKAYAEAIAILRISTTYGLNDARFIATLGGLLFLNGEFDEANKVFQESIRRDLSHDELHTVHFRSRKRGTNDPYTLEGRVLVVKPAYSLIEVDGYPKFLCHSSKYAGVQLRRDMKVRFQVEFSANGAIADRPVIVG